MYIVNVNRDCQLQEEEELCSTPSSSLPPLVWENFHNSAFVDSCAGANIDVIANKPVKLVNL